MSTQQSGEFMSFGVSTVDFGAEPSWTIIDGDSLCIPLKLDYNDKPLVLFKARLISKLESHAIIPRQTSDEDSTGLHLLTKSPTETRTI